MVVALAFVSLIAFPWSRRLLGARPNMQAFGAGRSARRNIRDTKSRRVDTRREYPSPARGVAEAVTELIMGPLRQCVTPSVLSRLAFVLLRVLLRGAAHGPCYALSASHARQSSNARA